MQPFGEIPISFRGTNIPENKPPDLLELILERTAGRESRGVQSAQEQSEAISTKVADELSRHGIVPDDDVAVVEIHRLCATMYETGFRDLDMRSKYKAKRIVERRKNENAGFKTDPQVTLLFIVKPPRRIGTCESSDYL